MKKKLQIEKIRGILCVANIQRLDVDNCDPSKLYLQEATAIHNELQKLGDKTIEIVSWTIEIVLRESFGESFFYDNARLSIISEAVYQLYKNKDTKIICYRCFKLKLLYTIFKQYLISKFSKKT